MTSLTKIILALGSNKDQQTNIEKAEKLVSSLLPNIHFSTSLWTDPIGIPESDKFLNCIGVATTRHDLAQVERALKQIERKCGRSKGEKAQGIIRLDIDILQYGDKIYHAQDWKRSYIKKLIREF